MADFRWNEWNLEHATKHGVSVFEAQGVVRTALRPWPRYLGDGKWVVEGRGQGDRFVKVIFLIDPGDTIYIIHAMPLQRGKRRRRR